MINQEGSGFGELGREQASVYREYFSGKYKEKHCNAQERRLHPD